MSAAAGSQSPPPLILLANSDEIFRRALESVLTHGGYRVIPAQSADGALAQARSRRPDGIILDLSLGRPHDFALCRALRAEPTVSLATPIILTARGRVNREQQLDALRAGAWELRGDPLDLEELLLRLAVYVEGKREVERVGIEGLVDRASGLYNAAGMARRAQELAALTARQGLALACAVFRPAVADGVDGDRLARAFKEAGRISDAIGRTGPAEFAVFAPATDAPAVARLVTRLSETITRAVNARGAARSDMKLEAGYSATTDAGTPAGPEGGGPGRRIDPAELLAQARKALDARMGA